MAAEQDLRDAFRALLAKKPYGDISIAEVCRTAGVSTKTLYAHYDGKPGLVRALIDEDIVEPVIELRRILKLEEIRSSTRLLLERAQEKIGENKAVYTNLIKSYGAEEFRSDYEQASYELNLQIYQSYGMSAADTEFAAFLLSSVQASVIIRWLTEPTWRDFPPKELARLLDTWAFAHFRELAAQPGNAAFIM